MHRINPINLVLRARSNIFTIPVIPEYSYRESRASVDSGFPIKLGMTFWDIRE